MLISFLVGSCLVALCICLLGYYLYEVIPLSRFIDSYRYIQNNLCLICGLISQLASFMTSSLFIWICSSILILDVILESVYKKTQQSSDDGRSQHLEFVKVTRRSDSMIDLEGFVIRKDE